MSMKMRTGSRRKGGREEETGSDGDERKKDDGEENHADDSLAGIFLKTEAEANRKTLKAHLLKWKRSIETPMVDEHADDVDSVL